LVGTARGEGGKRGREKRRLGEGIPAQS